MLDIYLRRFNALFYARANYYSSRQTSFDQSFFTVCGRVGAFLEGGGYVSSLS